MQIGNLFVDGVENERGDDMKLAVKKKTIIIVIIITVIVLGAFTFAVNLLTGTDDENIDKYSKALRASIDNEYYHYTLESRFEHRENESSKHIIEYYRSGNNNLRMDLYYENDLIADASYELIYDGKTYDLDNYDDVVDVAVYNYVNPTNGLPNGIDSTYYSINDRNVTYEETDSQMIVTYENKTRIGSRVEYPSKLEEEPDGYKSAVSVAYFDKDWNLQKLEITGKWDCITEDGKEEERVLHYTVTYQDTSNADIDKVLEDTLNEIKTALNE